MLRRIYIVILLVLSGFFVVDARGDSTSKQVQMILDATGVKGGFIVHINCDNGVLTAALSANDSYLVHGLETDVDKTEKARQYIQSKGIYCRVSVDTLNGDCLPYGDNLDLSGAFRA